MREWLANEPQDTKSNNLVTVTPRSEMSAILINWYHEKDRILHGYLKKKVEWAKKKRRPLRQETPAKLTFHFSLT